MEAAKSKKREWRLLGLIFLVAMGVRLIGIQFGYPLLVHPDEPNAIMPVLAMTQNHTLDPNSFAHPKQFLYMVYLVYLNLTSFLLWGVDMAAAFATHREVFHYIARCLIVVYGALIPLVAYGIGKRFKPNFALPAAILFAFYPLLVEHSHYATPDVPITFYTLLIIYFCLQFLDGKGEKFLLFAVLTAAINTADKYPGLLSLGIVFVAIVIDALHNRQSLPDPPARQVGLRLLSVTLLFALFLFLVAPFLFIDIEKVIPAIRNEGRSTALGSDGLGWLGNLRFYVRQFFQETNWLVVIFAVVGLFGLVKTKSWHGILLLYGVVYWLLLSYLPLHVGRWSLPMDTAPLLLAAFGMSWLWSQVHGPRPATAGGTHPAHPPAFLPVLMPLVTGGLIGATLLLVVSAGLTRSLTMSLTDTRAAALFYLKDAGITREETAYEGFSAFNPRGFATVFSVTPENPGPYRYLLLSSLMYGRYEAEPLRYPAEVAWYQRTRAALPLLKEFAPDPYPDTLAKQADLLFYIFKVHLGEDLPQRLSGPTLQLYQFPSPD